MDGLGDGNSLTLKNHWLRRKNIVTHDSLFNPLKNPTGEFYFFDIFKSTEIRTGFSVWAPN